MTRRTTQSGRTTPTQESAAIDHEIPSYRKRNPVMFWMVILGVFAMVLSTVAGFLSVLL